MSYETKQTLDSDVIIEDSDVELVHVLYDRTKVKKRDYFGLRPGKACKIYNIQPLRQVI